MEKDQFRRFFKKYLSMLDKVRIKTKEELEVMAEGGKRLGRVRQALMEAIKIGANAQDIEELADKLIAKEGGEASFKMVPGYKWATCINLNEGLVHGIPRKNVVFKKGDVVKLDVGMYYRGFHTDTSDSKGLEVKRQTAKFLEAGREALKAAIAKAKSGGRIYDISQAIETTIKGAGYTPIEALVGHGVGRELHEGPAIPCVVRTSREVTPLMSAGMVLAIEVMYAQGKPEVVIADDGWTILMGDAKIAALYEETVAVTPNGPFVLTEAKTT